MDQGYTDEQPVQAADEHNMHLEMVKLPEAKRMFVLLPHRGVVESRFAWTTRFRRLIRDKESLYL